MQKVAKFITAAVGALTQVIALGIMHGTALKDVQVGLAVVTALAVYLVPNSASPSSTPAPGT